MNQKTIRKFIAAATLAVSLTFASTANAATIQLGFILDSSGSIGLTNWGIITGGLANAMNLIPFGGTDTYEVSVVTFASTAVTNVTRVLVTDAATRTSLANTVAAMPFLNANTNFALAFAAMQNALDDTIAGAASSYVNFATDGVQNEGGTGITERNNLIGIGVDNIGVEGIGGGVDALDLQTNFCYPQACDTVLPFDTFPSQGFYLGVANAQQYANAIQLKVRVITGQQVPEPATMTLVGMGLLGAAVVRARRRRQN